MSLFHWIQRKKPPLLITHQRPDGDAIGSLVGLLLYLREQGIPAKGYFEDSLPERYAGFIPENKSYILVGKKIALEEYGSIVCLDTANEKRLGLPQNILSIQKINLPCWNVDHHPDNSCYGEENLICSSAAATAEIIADLLQKEQSSLSSEVATMLLLGIISDTGGFRFDNTTASTLKLASWLMDCNVDYGRIMRQLFFEEPLPVLKLQHAIYNNLIFAFNGRFIYFFLSQKMLQDSGISEKDTDGFVDSVRKVKNVDVVCRIQEAQQEIRFSLRSKNLDTPVDELAHSLGGGGHKMAAGACIKGIDFQQAEKLLLHHAKKIFI